MGTFADVSEENIKQRRLHTEPLAISLSTILKLREAKKTNQNIIAVGTTAIRTLESQADLILDKTLNDNIITNTDMFIMPGFDFKLTDSLITNFHVPKSSLMALVQAFLDHKKAKRDLISLYKIAIENEFKFYSFGDSMLIL
jgi:S-adenosylmethionine:tRNA ribosyltransferase-isomerase